VNTAEKIAASYLRLNGFLLLPQFTIFTGEQHNHIDVVALRPSNGIERVGGLSLVLDQKLFEVISDLCETDAKELSVGLAAEVKTNNVVEFPPDDHIEYVRNVLGPSTAVLSMCFTDRAISVERNHGKIIAGIRHALGWILERFEWMAENEGKLTKVGSWNWSDEFLADLLVLKSYGFLVKNGGCS
jgi:hypothetical protein